MGRAACPADGGFHHPCSRKKTLWKAGGRKRKAGAAPGFLVVGRWGDTMRTSSSRRNTHGVPKLPESRSARFLPVVTDRAGHHRRKFFMMNFSAYSLRPSVPSSRTRTSLSAL